MFSPSWTNLHYAFHNTHYTSNYLLTIFIPQEISWGQELCLHKCIPCTSSIYYVFEKKNKLYESASTPALVNLPLSYSPKRPTLYDICKYISRVLLFSRATILSNCTLLNIPEFLECKSTMHSSTSFTVSTQTPVAWWSQSLQR